MNGVPCGDVFSALGPDDQRARLIPAAKKMGRDRIYNDAKKVEVELGAFSTLDTLLSPLTKAARETASQLSSRSTSAVSWKTRLVMNLLGDHAPRRDNEPGQPWNEYLCQRRVIDFIGGMTDNYAIYLAKQIRGDGFAGTQRP